MGMDPTSIALLLGQLGSAGINAIAAPDGQELQSFEYDKNLDPRLMYGEAKTQIGEMSNLLKARANRPVTTRSGYVQQPPVFTGGGLPMPIGVSGMDPALADPSLLSLPGLGGKDPFNPDPPPPGPNPPPDDTDEGGRGGDRRQDPPRLLQANTAPGINGPARRTLPGQSLLAAPNVSEHDDLGQGAGAMELYLRSLIG